MPVTHLGIVAGQPLGVGEFALGRVEVAALSRFVCQPHMNVRATHGDQTANLDQRLGRVVNPQIEDRVAPGASSGFRLDDQNCRRLTAADVAAF